MSFSRKQRVEASVYDAELFEQHRVNESSLAHRGAFSGHREHLTALVCSAAPLDASSARLCVLGAGNCNDLDLERLSRHYAEIHLVDIDGDALGGAALRAGAQVRKRLFCHAPLDLSGILDRLERWRALETTPEELMACPELCSRAIAEALPGPFDVVLSACLLTQLHVSVLRVLTDRHQLFEAARQITNLIHLRSLLYLLRAGGQGILCSDVTSDLVCGLEKLESATDHVQLLEQLAQTGQLFYAVDPALLTLTCRADPQLNRRLRFEPLTRAWLWQNGPSRTFLSYALSFERVA